LGLPPDEGDNRRVLAVLRYLAGSASSGSDSGSGSA
jgi:hypothetical protein